MIDKTIKPLKVLIELPTWLGDCIMTTPAIENIVTNYNNIELTLIGPLNSIEIYKNHPKVVKVILLEKKYQSLYKIYSQLNAFDLYFSFRNSIRAKFLKFIITAKFKYQFDYKKYHNLHQVEKYVDFINNSLNINYSAGTLKIHSTNFKDKKIHKKIGINPGASYGSAKRWYPHKFAEIAIKLSDKFHIMIFGSDKEIDFAQEIETILIQNGIKNYTNLVGKTSVLELVNYISELDILNTGDSGPMHIAASKQIPTIAIFGPTNDKETSQWKNKNSIIIKKNLNCQPCMKRVCPLKHHKCMKLIKPQEIIDSINIIRPLYHNE